MITIINIIFFFAFIYWVYFLFKDGSDERGKKIGFYSSTAGVSVLVLGIMVLDIYSNFSTMSLETFKLWLNASYKIAIISVAIVTFTVDRYVRI